MTIARIVNACTRDGRGGSPTAVLDEGPFTDAERRELPVRLGTSHAVFVADGDDGSVALRFFTTEGELPACGHGTVAALALLAADAGVDPYRVRLRTAARVFDGWSTVEAGRPRADFDAGPVALRAPEASVCAPVLAALGLDPGTGGVRVAGAGRERLLIPVGDPGALAAAAPHFQRLREACDAAGLLGCFVYAPQAGPGRFAARMFAPSIGVDEDIANANSTACLAAVLGGRIEVDMGDALGSPATISARARTVAGGQAVDLGGEAVVGRVVRL